LNVTAWEAAIRILLVEDNPDLAQRLTEGLKGAGFAVDHAADGETAYRLGRSEDFDAVILDLGLPDMKGVDVSPSKLSASGRQALRRAKLDSPPLRVRLVCPPPVAQSSIYFDTVTMASKARKEALEELLDRLHSERRQSPPVLWLTGHLPHGPLHTLFSRYRPRTTRPLQSPSIAPRPDRDPHDPAPDVYIKFISLPIQVYVPATSTRAASRWTFLPCRRVRGK